MSDVLFLPLRMGRAGVYSKDENDAIRAVAKMLIARFGSQDVLAEKLEITQPGLSSVMTFKSGFGRKTAMKIAELASMTEPEMLRVGAELAKQPQDDYPNRSIVIDFARRAGFSESIVAQLKSAKPVRGRDLPAREWTHLLVSLNTIESDFTVDLEAPKSVSKLRPTRQK